jgi:hypothetical protein
VKPTAPQLSALSRLFSSSVFSELASRGKSALFARLLPQSGVIAEGVIAQSVGHAFDRAFAILRRAGQRDEYVYRAALTHKVLLGKHSLRTATMLTEFRVGSCKADLAILNGTAKVYEIKSERDSLARLANQVAHYRKVFAETWVIAAEAHSCDVLAHTDRDVGVMCLNRRGQITELREATDNAHLVCPIAVFESLRLPEARAVLEELGVTPPNVSAIRIHSAMRDCFSHLEPEAVHRAMVAVLKRSRSLMPLASLVDRLPESLRPAALSVRLRRSDHDRLVGAIGTPLSSALDWA